MVYDVDLVFQRDNPEKIVWRLQSSASKAVSRWSRSRRDAQPDNNWLDLDLELVNAKTGQVYPESIELEYYYGTDEDGAWSEGAKHNSVAISSAPAGEYYLTIEPSADPAVARMPYHLTPDFRRGSVLVELFRRSSLDPRLPGLSPAAKVWF